MQSARSPAPRPGRRHLSAVVRFRTLTATRKAFATEHVRLGAAQVANRDEPSAQRRFRAIVDGSNTAVALLDNASRRRNVSLGAAGLLGVAVAELVGQLVSDRVHPDDLLRQRDLFSSLLEDPNGSVPWNCRLRHADGTWRWFDGIATNRLTDPDVGAVVVTLRDVTDRVAAAATLRASEERFRALWDIAVDAMALSDEQGIVLQANPAYCELYGLPREAVVGQPLSIIYPAEVRAQANIQYRTVFGKEAIPPMFEATVQRSDGTERIVESRSTFLTEDGRRVAMLSIVRDVTERVRAQVAYDQLAAIVESSEDAIVGSKLDGTITSWNGGAERLYGYRTGEALGQASQLIVPPERVAELHDLLYRIGRGERISRLETVRLLKDGSIVPVALTVSPIRGADGEITGVSAIARDISERHRIQGQLLTINQRLRVALGDHATSQARLHDLFMQAPAIIATVRGPNHVFELVNPHYVQMVGRSHATELVGKPIREVLPELASQGYFEIVDQVFATGKVFVGEDMPVRLCSGEDGALEDHFVTFIVQPSHDATGAVDGLLMFATDVTDQIRAQRQMIQQERLRALGEMASGIAHDFNNALAPVVGFSELLLMVPGTIENPTKVRQYVEMIFTSAKDAAAVVSRLGDFARTRDEGDVLKPVDLGPLVAQVISLTRPRWHDQALASGRTVQVKMNRTPSPPVAGRAPELREILTNLLFNADDAMPKGGTITISVQPGSKGSQLPRIPVAGASASAIASAGIGARTRAAGGGECAGVLLSVHDTGIGMSEETRRRCLEPFYTTKGQHGTGLGLAMVYGIVCRAGGDLTIESAPGQGTTVTVCLPAFVTPSTPEDTVPPATAAPLRVLVVDDEAGVRQVTMEYLMVDGHLPRGASGGRAALECLRAPGPAAFDLVITDRAMPEMNGDDLALAIKAMAPRLPVLLLTGFGGLIDRSGVPGVDAVLSKPITLAGLRQALSRIPPAPAAPQS